MKPHSSPRQKALLAAGTLATGKTIDSWSQLAALAVIIALVAFPEVPAGVTAALGLSLLAGIAQMYLAVRTTLDERIFAGWGACWTEDATRAAEDLAGFDAAMHEQFGKTTAPRSLDNRLAGALRLLKRQALALGAQILLLTLALALRYLAG